MEYIRHYVREYIKKQKKKKMRRRGKTSMTFQFLGLKYNEEAILTVSLVIRWFSELLDYCDVKDTDRLDDGFHT